MGSALCWKVEKTGLRRFRTAYCEVARKNGKALAVETPVPTPEGWKPHGELRPGDLVFGPDGLPRRVIATTDAYRGPCHELRVSDGFSVIAHERHEWLTERTWFTKRRRGVRQQVPLPPMETREIAATLRSGRRQDHVHRIPMAEPLHYPARELPIPPYVLGAWLGDGHSAAPRLTSADQEIVDRIRSEGVPIQKSSGKYLYTLTNGRTGTRVPGLMLSGLRALKVLNNKHIPACYLTASIPQRVDLLQGLMDTDGCASLKGQCEWTGTKERLARDVRELLLSLGIKARLHTGRAKLRGRDVGPKYRLRFFPPSGLDPFSLSRKLERAKTPWQAAAKRRSRARTVVGADPCGEQMVNCIQVEGGVYLAGPGMVATHNSTLVAGLALRLAFFDGEEGAETYSAATHRDQAKIVWTEAKRMVRKTPALASRITPMARVLTREDHAQKFEPLGADEDTMDGLNVHAAIIDELHAHKGRGVWDLLETATGSRRQPLTVAITTAGWDRTSICWEQHDYAAKVLQGIVEDDSYFGFIASIDEADDWRDPSCWVKANPCLGVSVKLEDLERLCKRAQEMPAAQNTFKRLRLSCWTEQSERWLDMAVWDRCEMPLADLIGRHCYGGLDLASTNDIAALLLAFPGEDDWIDLLARFWVPADSVAKRSRRGVPYDAWVRDGWIKATPGDVIDYDVIRTDIVALMEQFELREVAVDRWNATQITTQLQGEGLTMIPMGQGFASMSAPTKELATRLQKGRIRHGGNPVLRWMASNVATKEDSAGNLKPDRKRSTEKIDGIVAAIMAVDRVTRSTGPSVYETRGVLRLGADA